MKSFSIQNFGCRVNQAEAFSWAEEFAGRGLQLEKDFTQSDLIVVNTCTLTGRADRDARRFIQKVKRINPEAKLVVTGCLAERERQEFEPDPGIWQVFSNREKGSLAVKILSDLEPQEKTASASYRSRALLKIQDGCDFACTFCIIPSVRGKGVSLEKSRVLASLRRLISQGFREVVLTGIHLCSYGLDLDPSSSLLELLRDIEKLGGLGRVRLSSLDPRFLDPPLIDFLTRSPKICPHFHLSLQSASRRILRRMGRKTDVSQFREILHRLQQNSPDAAIGADIIVGFPGESEDDFALTYDFLEQAPLTYFHVFSYSPRPGTPASSWPPVEEGLKQRRASRLRELSLAKNLAFRRLFIGRALNAIVIEKKNGGADALTSNYIKVHLPSCPVPEGRDIQVEIEGVSARQNWGSVFLS